MVENRKFFKPLVVANQASGSYGVAYDWRVHKTVVGDATKTIEEGATTAFQYRVELEALPEAARRASALPVLHQWARQGDGRQGPPLDATRMRRALRELTPWDDLPPLTEAFIHGCLASMAALGLIDALPERRGGGADADTRAAAP